MEYLRTRAQNLNPNEAATEACQAGGNLDGGGGLPLPFSMQDLKEEPPQPSALLLTEA